MPNQFVKETFGAENKTKIVMLGDSVPGAWSFNDRYNSSVYDWIEYLKERGLKADLVDLTITGGGYYSSRPADYVIEPWMNFSSGEGGDVRFADRSVEKAISLGATHVLVLFGSREATQGNVNPNPDGDNYFGEETIVLMEAYKAKFDAEGIETIFSTTNASPTLTNYQEKFTPLTEVIRTKCAEFGWNYIDVYDIMTDPLTGLGRPGDFIDAVHWAQDNGTGIGHGRFFDALVPYFNNLYSLTQPVWELTEDTPCDGNELLLDDNNIALTDDNGNFLFGDP